MGLQLQFPIGSGRAGGTGSHLADAVQFFKYVVVHWYAIDIVNRASIDVLVLSRAAGAFVLCIIHFLYRCWRFITSEQRDYGME